jgi:hypothetical protein
MQVRDWFVILLFASAWIAGTIYLFLHPAEGVFVAWAGMASSMGCAYHWMMVRDQKIPDAAAGGQ